MTFRAAFLVLALIVFEGFAPIFGASAAHHQTLSVKGQWFTLEDNSSDLRVFNDPLTPEYFLGMQIAYRSGSSVVTLKPGDAFTLTDGTSVRTILGTVGVFRLTSRSGISGWITLPEKTLKLLSSRSAPASLNVDRDGLSSRWRSDGVFLSLLPFALLFGSFMFGLLIRNLIFDGRSWKPIGCQLLLSIPISLVVVPGHILTLWQLLPTSNLVSFIASFLMSAGLVTIEGILLPESSRRLIENKMRKLPGPRRTSTVTPKLPATQPVREIPLSVASNNKAGVVDSVRPRQRAPRKRAKASMTSATEEVLQTSS